MIRTSKIAQLFPPTCRMIVAPSFRGGCLFFTVNLLERKQTLLVDPGIDSVKPIISNHERCPLAPSPACGGGLGWGRHSGTADLSAASSAEASAKAEATGDGVCGLSPTPTLPRKRGRGSAAAQAPI